jgi:hypothetical protein
MFFFSLTYDLNNFFYILVSILCLVGEIQNLNPPTQNMLVKTVLSFAI